MEEKYPYFIYPVIEKLKATSDNAEALELKEKIAVNVGDPLALHDLLGDTQEEFRNFYSEKFGQAEMENAFLGRENRIRMQIIYYPEINEYNGMEQVQIVIRNYR